MQLHKLHSTHLYKLTALWTVFYAAGSLGEEIDLLSS